MVRRMVRRLVEIVVTVIILVLTMPVLLLVAAAIRLDSRGPLFVGRPCRGPHRVFNVWSFRTRSLDDAELTRVGHWLRRWSLHYMPQLFNVLAGDMRLVGPWPQNVN